MKQVIVVRKDLKMKKGKIGSQVAHASLGALLSIANRFEDEISIPLNNNAVKQWLEESFTKIVLSVNSEEELLELYEKVKVEPVPSCLITDNGNTVFDGVKTNTCVGIGPADDEILNVLTGHLKLL